MTERSPLSRVPEYLEHMRDAIDRAASYLEQVADDEAFESDWKTQDAVIRNIEVIGEAANKIIKADPSISDRHPDIEWGQMRAMRNKMIHDYFEIDPGVVWQTVKADFPSLRRKIVAVLASIG